MRVLIVKTSSMGDVIHTLPALTDAGLALPGIHFDWLVEENFAEIPRWHPLVTEIIPIAWRRWRKQILRPSTWQAVQLCRQIISKKQYDLIIDAQGLIKSACFANFAKGPVAGLDKHSAREPLASLFYQRKFHVAKGLHAVTRIRSLFSQALGYAQPETVADYGINRDAFLTSNTQTAYLVFLHGTTWATKHWPEKYWTELAKKANKAGLTIKLLWGSAEEKARAERIANSVNHAEVLPRLTLKEIACVLAGAKAIVAVDTGFGHLAAALDVPTVSLYGSTNPVLTGAMGKSQIHLASSLACSPCLSKECVYPGNKQDTDITVNPPCFSDLPPERVWERLEQYL